MPWMLCRIVFVHFVEDDLIRGSTCTSFGSLCVGVLCCTVVRIAFHVYMCSVAQTQLVMCSIRSSACFALCIA